MPVILALRRCRQEAHHLEAILDYIATLCLRTKVSLTRHGETGL